MFDALDQFSTDIVVRNTAVTEAFRQVVNYVSTQNVMVSGRDGDDLFIVNDSSTELLVKGDAGADRFFIGNVLSTKKYDDPRFGLIDVVDKITNGVSFPAEFRGGSGNDYFEVNHNVAEISLYGESGDDTFFLQAHLTTDSATDNFTPSEEINVHSEEGERDILSYVKNAPVNIFGGDGFDTLVVLGTPVDDTFTIFVEEDDIDGVPTPVQRIYGAGLIVPSIQGIERLVIVTGAGDDTVYLYGTLDDQEIQVITGSGNDTVHVGGESVDLNVVVPESKYTQVNRIPQDDIVNTVQVVTRAAYSYQRLIGYGIDIGPIKLYPQYQRVYVPATSRPARSARRSPT